MKKWKLALSLLALTAPAPAKAHASAILKPTSGVTQALTAKSLSIDTHLKGAFAQTTVTTVYGNPNSDRIEADFLYSAPQGCVVTGFAYWYGGEKVMARVVEKGRAAKIYQYITSRMRDPALVEMIGKNSFRARIFPIEANADLKIEIQLAQALPTTKEGALWTYPLREETQDGSLENFSLLLHSDREMRSNLGPLHNGQLQIKKSNFKATEDARAVVLQNAAPLRASVIAARDGGPDGFFALSLTSDGSISHPFPILSGVRTYDVVAPVIQRLAAGKTYTVYGRYRGGGPLCIDLSGRKVYVNLPARSERRNVASLLWAANRIEFLSTRAKNREAVMALSKRFGVPSKWTSWLAIPAEERTHFKKQMIASDRNEAARLYAQAVARGDAGSAVAQKQAVKNLTAQLEKIGHDYSSEEELLPLQSYLNEELKNVRRAVLEAKYGGASQSQRVQWGKWVRNLQDAGAKDGAEGVETPVYVLEDELRIASRLLTIEVEAGREKGAKAKSLENRLKELGEGKVAQRYGWGADTFTAEQAEMRANALAMEIAADRLSDTPHPARQEVATRALTRLHQRFGVDSDAHVKTALNSMGMLKSQSLALEVARAEHNGQLRPAPVRSKLERLAKAMDVKLDDLLKGARTEVMRQDYNNATDELVSEILAGREGDKKAQQLTEQVGNFSQKSEDWWQKNALSRAYNGRAHQLAFQLEAEKVKPSPDRVKVTELTTRLQKVATLAQGSPVDQYLQWEKSRLASGQNSFDIEAYRYRVAGLNPNDFRSGSYGAGDPLIAIEAPSDARSVVAIMPDGAIKNLEWRVEKGRWEANFDISTDAALGSYLITVVVIEKDGRRRVVRLRYDVDGSAPHGKATLATEPDSDSLKLDIAASDDVERVTALLPWNERLILRRNAQGSFVSTVPVPSQWRGLKLEVHFILTDKAHNRTELLVDWN